MRPSLRLFSRVVGESSQLSPLPRSRSRRVSSASRSLVPYPNRPRCQLVERCRAYSLNTNEPKTSSPKGISKPSPHVTSSTSEPPPTSTLPSDDDGCPDPPPPNLPSQAERRRTETSKRFTHLMDHLQSNIFFASQRLNDLTGYSGIESLKASIEAQEALASETRAIVRDAKDAYTTAIAQRSASQREVNELLQRKHGWSPTDLERFTALYRSDHANELAEQAAADALATAEAKAEETATRLSKSILARYHEEQIWSDKIRRMSTWGTWGLMGVNILLFVVFQVAVEPWRRKRLVSGFEEKVKEALEREKEMAIPTVGEAEEGLTATVDALAEEVTSSSATSTSPPSSQPPIPADIKAFKTIKISFVDLVSDRAITIRKVDLTTAVLEGAAAGAAVVGATLWLLLLRRG